VYLIAPSQSKRYTFNLEIQKAPKTIDPGDAAIANLNKFVCCPSEHMQKVLELVTVIDAANRKSEELEL
jgi:hypothetical protein